MGQRLKIAHVVFRLDYGGLENGLVNLLNRLPPDEFEHLVVALTTAGRFRRRLPAGVRVVELHKPRGRGLGYLRPLARLLRAEGVDILHTRNLACLESQLAGLAAGVPVRIHGEHGWDVFDLHGRRRRYRLLRWLFRAVVDHYVVVSRHLGDYLRGLGVPAARISHITNGVDVERFRPADGRPASPFVIGSVGRLEAVKDYPSLAQAFARLARDRPGAGLRLAIVGDGSQRAAVEQVLGGAGLLEHCWLPGFQDDVPAALRRFSLFVLPSLAEGISNTILEAMATGLPVVATAVGGNPELVVDGVTGRLVPPGQPERLAAALAEYADEPALAAAHGRAGRDRVVREFSIPVMAAKYRDLYRQLAGRSH